MMRCGPATALLNAYQDHLGRPSRPFHHGRAIIVNKRGADLLHDPWFNKHTAFEAPERDRLGLRGLLPPGYQTMEEQMQQFMRQYEAIERKPRSSDDPVDLQKWRILNRLHDRNETLYYRILMDNIEEMSRIVYTPTVGMVCQRYASLFRRPRGMYFSANDQGEMASMVHNWPSDHVDIIVITDGSRVLGVGDCGVQAVSAPVGKLDMYVAAAGINPNRVLPVVFDVGTNNSELMKDPLYLGLRHPRIDGEEYLELIDEFMEANSSCFVPHVLLPCPLVAPLVTPHLGLRHPRIDGEDYLELIDEFMEAVTARWPNVIVQFEDMERKWAHVLMDRYRHQYRTFNDDIQGMGGLAVAAVTNVLRAQELPPSELANCKTVVTGAGSAVQGMLVALQKAMVAHLGESKHNYVQAARNFWIVDNKGLMTEARGAVPNQLRPFLRPAAEAREEGGLQEGAHLAAVIKACTAQQAFEAVGPNVLFLSGVSYPSVHSHNLLFHVSLLPLSHPFPPPPAECTAQQAFEAVGPNVLFLSGVSYPSVHSHNLLFHISLLPLSHPFPPPPAECTAQQAFEAVGPNVLFLSGVSYPSVHSHNLLFHVSLLPLSHPFPPPPAECTAQQAFEAVGPNALFLSGVSYPSVRFRKFLNRLDASSSVDSKSTQKQPHTATSTAPALMSPHVLILLSRLKRSLTPLPPPHPPSCHLMSSYTHTLTPPISLCVSPFPIPSHPIPSHPIPSRPIPSHPVPSRPTTSHPSIAAGALLSGARLVSEGMIHAAANEVAHYISDDDVKKGILFPSLSSIRDITSHVAVAVARKAAEEGLAEGIPSLHADQLLTLSKEGLRKQVEKRTWVPAYSPLIFGADLAR
ncbi:unnamed protein product [Closterium sp. NIES-53]